MQCKRIDFAQLISVLLLSCSIPVFAYASSDADLDDLLSMDIKDLKVSVASKRDESIRDAPGIISVVTKEDIYRYGGNTLNDVLERLPGVFNGGAQDIHDNMVSIRGQHSSSINKHLLILLNGRPMREGYSAGSNTAIYRGFPLSAVERIEVIRGPGSVLYGSGAFSGVINIITKKSDSKKIKQEFTGSYGSFNWKHGEYALEKQIGEKGEGNILAAFKAVKTDGFKVNMRDASNNIMETEQGSKDQAGTAQFNYKGLSLNLFNGYTNDTLYNPPTYPTEEHTAYHRSMADLGYTLELPADWKAQFNITYGYTRSGRATSSLHYYSNDNVYEATLDGPITDKLKLLVGTAYTDQQGWDLGITMPFHQVWKSQYTQVDFLPVDWLKLIGGAQMNDTGQGYKTSPRAASIFYFDKMGLFDGKFAPDNHAGVKLLYGEAYRSPSGLETSFFIPGAITGNKNLKPEIIKTFDAQVFYSNPHYEVALTYFKSKQEDSISVTYNNAINLLEFSNIGPLEYQGGELEGKWRINQNWALDGSVSLQENETEDNIKDSQVTPNLLAKLGVTYDNQHGFIAGIFDNYSAGQGRARNLDPTTVQDYAPEGKDYHNLSLNMRLNAQKFFDDKSLLPITFSLYGVNLLEPDTVYLTDMTFLDHNAGPLRSGRAIYANATLNF